MKAFRLHCTLAEIEQRIDELYSAHQIINDADAFLGACEIYVHIPLAEVFPDNPSRYKHNSSKRAYARGYAAGRLKSIQSHI